MEREKAQDAPLHNILVTPLTITDVCAAVFKAEIDGKEMRVLFSPFSVPIISEGVENREWLLQHLEVS